MAETDYHHPSTVESSAPCTTWPMSRRCRNRRRKAVSSESFMAVAIPFLKTRARTHAQRLRPAYVGVGRIRDGGIA